MKNALHRDSPQCPCQGYTIRSADPEHLPLLHMIERAAATIFPAGTIPDHILADRIPLTTLQEAQTAGRLWLALAANDKPVGYALLQVVDGYALLAQLDVHPTHGQQGLGTALVQRVIQQVRTAGLPALYLTTFSHVPWNAPFYQKRGFRPLSATEQVPFIQNILHEERARGLQNRVAMQLRIQT